MCRFLISVHPVRKGSKLWTQGDTIAPPFSGREASRYSFHLLSWQTGAMLGLFFLSIPLPFVFVLLSCFVSFYILCLLQSVLHFLYSILYFGYHIYNFQRFFFCIVSFHTIFFFMDAIFSLTFERY